MTDHESYTAIRVRQADAEKFRRFVRQLAASADRDVTQTEALGTLADHGLDHVADVAARLTAPPGGAAALSDRTDATAGK
jgi:hypothetical protein